MSTEPERQEVNNAPRPTTEQWRAALRKERRRINFAQVLRSTVYTLIVVAALSVLTAVLFLPVLRIYGSSMAPTLSEGDIVVSIKGSSFSTGDVVAFYYNNRILVKRVIGGPGDWVDMNSGGEVSVNGTPLWEPYLIDRAYGDCNIEFPYQVPESRWFVMGDHRSVSVDSRHTAVGCVAEEQIIGKLVFCIWPLEKFGPVR